MSKQKAKASRGSQKNLSNIGRTTVDNKLTHSAMMLNYQFEWGVDFTNRIINLVGEIDEKAFEKVDQALTTMEADNRQKITIKINSPGGDTYQALAIVGRMRESPCYIHTKGYGHIMSAAALILAAGNKRRMSDVAFFMWHEASYGIEGRHSENKAVVKQMEKEERLWAQQMAECSNKSETYWSENGILIDAYYTAEQLLKMEVVDELF